jgi:hypothetical protein
MWFGEGGGPKKKDHGEKEDAIGVVGVEGWNEQERLLWDVHRRMPQVVWECHRENGEWGMYRSDDPEGLPKGFGKWTCLGEVGVE